MARAESDRNLLFGLLAVQMDFITRDALFAAMQAWAFDKGRPIGQILIEQEALRPRARDLIEALVGEHLALHDGDPARSLAAVSSAASAREQLRGIDDADLQASLAHVPETRDDPRSPDATRTWTVGVSTSSGTRFRILRPHARGGLGEVFVALDSELNREVALKEIQAHHADHAESRSRFVLEAEVTGGLEHPNIVPVYGLGSYDDGRPYYAMRFIRGDSLKDAIARFHAADKAPGRDPGERGLALRKLLGRFIDVCNAMAYAHSRGVLHRDLKPGNVMLGKYGETLVVDWGLAKPLGKSDESARDGEERTLRPSSASGSQETLPGSAVGTPAYMSPEQAAGDLARLGPASDVYSLGATLYCLLTGRAPFEGREVGVLLQKVQRGEFPPPRAVRADVPAALESICLKAMALRPEGRYPTPRGLADDLEHWLADEPVSAHREGWGDRLARWSRRHRAWVRAGAAALAVGLIAAVALAIQQSRAADRERVIAGRERTAKTLAQARLAQVERGVGLLASVFRDLDPRAEEKEDRPLRTILGDRIDRVAVQLAGESVGEATAVAGLQDALGQAQLGLGHAERAIELLDKAVRTRRARLGPDHPDTLRSRGNLALAYRDAGRVAEAAELFEETLRLSVARLGPDHPDTLTGRHNLAEAYFYSGRAAEAAKMDAETLRLRVAKLGPDHTDTLASRNNLAASYRAVGRAAEATTMDEETLRLRIAKLGPDHPHTLDSRNNLATLYFDAGRVAEAAELFEETLRLSVARLGPDHPDTLTGRNNLAHVYLYSGRVAEAIKLHDETLRLSVSKLGPDHPDTLSSRNSLAHAYFYSGRAAQAAKMDEETLRLYIAKLGPDHPDTLNSRNNLAAAYEGLGRWSEAEPLRRDLVTRLREAVPPDRPALAGGLARLGLALLRQDRWSEAELILRECLTIRAEAKPDAWQRFNTMSQLGGALLGLGRHGEAEPLVVGGYEGMKAREAKIPATGKARLPEAAERVVRLYEAWGKPERAKEWKSKLGLADLPADVFARP